MLIAMRDSAFSHRISDVVCTGSEKQMLRIDTGGHITAMQDPQPIWNRSMRQDPDKAMGQDSASLPRRDPITFRQSGASPQPAVIRLSIRLLHQSMKHDLGSGRACRSTDKRATDLCQILRLRIKVPTTFGTGVDTLTLRHVRPRMSDVLKGCAGAEHARTSR